MGTGVFAGLNKKMAMIDFHLLWRNKNVHIQLKNCWALTVSLLSTEPFDVSAHHASGFSAIRSTVRASEQIRLR
jgi:hypothetical protein